MSGGAGRSSGVVAVATVLPLLVFGTVFGLLLVGGSAAACTPASGSGVVVDPSTVPDGPVAGYRGEQLVNAAWVMTAGADLGLDVRDQTIGVMTAMGESSLRVIDHGDAAGPDSRGLFQQRANGAWGSYADRMDPYISSTNFFTALMRVPDRETLAPTIVAHRVQRNADPYHYERYWAPAVQVVEALAGVSTDLAGPGQCSGDEPGAVGADGWAVPAAGPIRSPFGMRLHPVDKVWRLHAGVDLGGGGCDGPIWAANDGVVTFSGFDPVGNGTITLDHGGSVRTNYLHQYASGLLVRVGDRVSSGDLIGRVGSSGKSTGCHLHFGVRLDGTAVDPVPFMAERRAQLG